MREKGLRSIMLEPGGLSNSSFVIIVYCCIQVCISLHFLLSHFCYVADVRGVVSLLWIHIRC
jgi:hypothetical protein